jgi:hypothetical protein
MVPISTEPRYRTIPLIKDLATIVGQIVIPLIEDSCGMRNAEWRMRNEEDGWCKSGEGREARGGRREAKGPEVYRASCPLPPTSFPLSLISAAFLFKPF